MAEAWVATFKSELVAGRRFPGFEHAEHQVLSWIAFYNSERLHEELGDIPPAEFEVIHSEGGRAREPFGLAEAGRPARLGGAPAGLGTPGNPMP